ncbi:adenine-specific DNA-methyltransferase [Eubacterium barkeri]|uniref:Adenine-specific DNA-methyltransferase n=1 Tax=Eubacterium barkeri TaxID=1528 RepID=A0A1H3J8T5_EUBBA|nr:adenine-specific DNA-methyltransferase [Eubacterium barkeri]
MKDGKSVKYIPYIEENPIKGNAAPAFDLEGIRAEASAAPGMPLYDMTLTERVGKDVAQGMLIHGECIAACAWLKEKRETVDLVYIDPPFASGAHYTNRMYLRGKPHTHQAFEETMYSDIWKQGDYLKWMYKNLLAIRSVMRESASIYVHLDWHICHYIKILMDDIFGAQNFLNEIIWSYKSGGASTASFAKKHDTLYLYAKNKGHHLFNPMKEKSYNRGFKPYRFKNVKEYQDDVGWYTQVNMRDVWEIDMVGRTAGERVDYITQKPEALLERIITASSGEGMVVADFFGGSGVAAGTASRLGRRFIHCDVGINSINVTRDRLKKQGTGSFSIYRVEDDLSLYRNPIQTMEQLKAQLPKFQKEKGMPKVLAGTILEEGERIPIYLPNLLDRSSHQLEASVLSQLQQARKTLKKKYSKIRVYHLLGNIDCQEEGLEFVTLKPVLEQIGRADEALWHCEKNQEGYTLRLKQFKSDHLKKSIEIYNKKKEKNKGYKAIHMSSSGLELVEMIALDCENDGGIWTSSEEIHIDKWGFLIYNNVKFNTLWDGTIRSSNQPKRLKIRNIAGDETVWKIV